MLIFYQLINFRKNFVELQWTPPANDGGSKVTGYVVEKKQAGSDFWLKAHPNHSIPELQCQISELIENAEYEFRVKAINKAGESEPSFASSKVKITEYPGKINIINFLYKV